ncbi:MAG: hypothetical protein FWD92_06385 [Methanomassiliicoccaceae archaeon]|nr:hypothetical protein [Methanomassiliicoccaceae archaeon]
MKLPILTRKKSKNGNASVRFEDGLLFTDCRDCNGISSLEDAECVRCVSKQISENGSPSRLIMRKDADVEYSEDTVMILNGISKIVSITDAASSEKLTGVCKGCSSSVPKNAENIWNSFPEPRFDMMRLEAERSVPNRNGCEECLHRTMEFIDRAETMFSEIREKAAKTAFHLTEV